MDPTEANDMAAVVEWASPRDAEQQWNTWLAAHPATASGLDLVRDLVIDVGRTSHGNQHRYSVRRAAIRD